MFKSLTNIGNHNDLLSVFTCTSHSFLVLSDGKNEKKKGGFLCFSSTINSFEFQHKVATDFESFCVF